MTRFDERFDADRTRTWPAALRLVAGDPMVFCIAIAAVVVVAIVAAAAVLSAGELASRRAALTGSSRFGVFLDPQLGRTDAERLKPAIDALPQVAGAVLRTRDEALESLARSGLPALQTRANPLPDVWIVSMKAAATGEVDSQQTRVRRLKAALEALPGVQSVQVDLAWADWIDRWSPVARTAILVAAAVASGLALLGGLGIFFLAGRAARGDGGRAAFSAAGFACGLVGLTLAALLIWVTALGLGLPSTVWNFGRPLGVGPDVGAALCAIVALTLAGCALGCGLQRK